MADLSDLIAFPILPGPCIFPAEDFRASRQVDVVDPKEKLWAPGPSLD